MPGRALDLGCGEGADVLWLADGRAVTAVDIAQTALDRGAAEVARRGLAVDWRCADLAEELTPGAVRARVRAIPAVTGRATPRRGPAAGCSRGGNGWRAARGRACRLTPLVGSLT